MKNLAELNLDARGTYNVHLSEYNRIWENKMWHLSESRPFKLRGNLSRKEAAFLGSCFGCVWSHVSHQFLAFLWDFENYHSRDGFRLVRDSEGTRLASAHEVTVQMLLDHPSQRKSAHATLQPLPCKDGWSCTGGRKKSLQFLLGLGLYGGSLMSSQEPPLALCRVAYASLVWFHSISMSVRSWCKAHAAFWRLGKTPLVVSELPRVKQLLWAALSVMTEVRSAS